MVMVLLGLLDDLEGAFYCKLQDQARKGIKRAFRRQWDWDGILAGVLEICVCT